MGIMNKMKTVAAWELNWWVTHINNRSFFYTNYFFGKTASTYRYRVSMSGDKTYNNDGYIGSPYTFYVIDNSFVLAANEREAFIQYLTDNHITITYETADSVDEKIVSYHAPQLIDWTKHTNSTDKGITYTNKGNGLFNVSGKLNAGEDYATFYFNKGRDGRIIKSKIGHIYACGITRIGNKRDVKNSGVQGVQTRQFYFDEYSVYIFEAMSNNSDINFYVNIGSRTEQLNQDFYPYFVDLTELYGAGNEPRNATFLQQHPEYNKFVPFNEGLINITEEII